MKNPIQFFAILLLFSISYLLPISSQAQWTSLTSGTTDILWAVDFYNDDVGYVVGQNGRILKTSNGGSSWTSQDGATSQFLRDVFALNKDTVAAVGYLGTYRLTYDGGVSWTDKIEVGTTVKLEAIEFVGSTGFIVGETGVIFKSTDGGESWTSVTSPTSNKINDIYMYSATIIYIVGDMNDIYKSNNGGTTWTSQSASFPETNSNFAVFAPDANNAILCGGVSRIAKTSNGGTTWSTNYNTSGSYWRGVYYSDATTGYVVGQGGNILYTSNGSSYTTQTSGTTQDLNDIDFLSTGVGYVVANGGVILKKGTPVVSAPVGNYSYSANNLVLDFTDLSTNAPTSFSWDFGDGTAASTSQNPSHTFAQSGDFNVCLTVTNSGGTDTYCSTVTVTNIITPNAAFKSSENGLVVEFTDLSTNTPTSWVWTFGDGNNATTQNPTHTYDAAGTYNVCLTVTNSAGSTQKCQDVTVTVAVQTPVADFSNSANNLVVTFTDLSTNTPTSWDWNFGDGNVSADQNPTHTYNAPGDYNVCVTATNSAGSNQKCMNVSVSAPAQAPIADFSNSGNDLVVTFSDQSTNTPTSWAWTFGDGNVSTAQFPSNTYTTPGTYNVCLTATNSAGSNQICKDVIVTSSVLKPVADFSSSDNNLVVDFKDLSTNIPTSWFWAFGDGNTSTSQFPTNTYAAAGTYNVCLTATNSAGSNMICKDVTVNAGTIVPVASFTFNVTEMSVQFTDASTNTPTAWSWDFGDSQVSTAQNPTHDYTVDGTYQVCLTAANGGGSDSTCQSVTVIKTEIANSIEKANILVYPNPTTSGLTIKIPNDQTINLISVYDLSGKEVLALKPNVSQAIVFLDLTEKGMYMLKINSGQEYVKFIVVQ